MTSLPHSLPVAPVIQNRQQLDAVIENIVQMQVLRTELESRQEQEIASIRQKYRAPLAELERYLALETAWAEAWARANPGLFREQQAVERAHATIGFRVTPPRVDRASRKWTWTAVALRLGEMSWGERYLRIPPPEVNKEALLADRGKFSPEELREAGLKIVNDERFFVTPHGVNTSTASDLEPDWQEAA